jgi:hypothetical protein
VIGSPGIGNGTKLPAGAAGGRVSRASGAGDLYPSRLYSAPFLRIPDFAVLSIVSKVFNGFAAKNAWGVIGIFQCEWYAVSTRFALDSVPKILQM